MCVPFFWCVLCLFSHLIRYGGTHFHAKTDRNVCRTFTHTHSHVMVCDKIEWFSLFRSFFSLSSIKMTVFFGAEWERTMYCSFILCAVRVCVAAVMKFSSSWCSNVHIVQARYSLCHTEQADTIRNAYSRRKKNVKKFD